MKQTFTILILLLSFQNIFGQVDSVILKIETNAFEENALMKLIPKVENKEEFDDLNAKLLVGKNVTIDKVVEIMNISKELEIKLILNTE